MHSWIIHIIHKSNNDVLFWWCEIVHLLILAKKSWIFSKMSWPGITVCFKMFKRLHGQESYIAKIKDFIKNYRGFNWQYFERFYWSQILKNILFNNCEFFKKIFSKTFWNFLAKNRLFFWKILQSEKIFW